MHHANDHGLDPIELTSDLAPEYPWCENWREVVDFRLKGLKGPSPVNPNPRYMKGWQDKNSYSTAGYKSDVVSRRAKSEKSTSDIGFPINMHRSIQFEGDPV